MASSYGIVGESAPMWGEIQWYRQGKPERFPRLRQKEWTYLYLWQAWTPACRGHGVKTFQSNLRRFAGLNIRWCAVQTAFEGRESNTTAAAKGLSIQMGQRVWVGHQEGVHLMQGLRSGGTPWTAIIDPSGRVRWNGVRASGDGFEDVMTCVSRRAQADVVL